MAKFGSNGGVLTFLSDVEMSHSLTGRQGLAPWTHKGMFHRPEGRGSVSFGNTVFLE
jgi:hypothetical protein